MLNKVRDYLRENEGYSDDEIQDLIDAAKADLILSGVHKDKIVDTDPLVKRAITLYCKAHFGYEHPKLSERFQESYISLKHHLTLSAEYTEVV
ncbi:head-tail connector protein [Tissierella praeacuta]|uniref:head-tail connector protein n=1 Tax=Tissierella praeacuta TaxID=43131 RepID=UPI0028AFE524|nr:head-tail connector protein [Tissierella praeacuta]